MGASNHTYNTFPSESGKGTFTPQLLSLVIARLCRPLSSQLLHWPYTLFFHSLCPSMIHSFSQGSYFCRGKYQCFVLRLTGVASLKALRGLTSCSGLRAEPQRSPFHHNTVLFPFLQTNLHRIVS